MTSFVQALVANAAKSLSAGSPSYRHNGRGEADPIPSYDVIGFTRAVLSLALGNPNLPDMKPKMAGALLTEQLEELALAWGMQRIPAKEARVGDVIVFDTKTDGALFGIISQDCGSNKHWDEGRVIGGLWCRGAREFYMTRERRNTAAAFRAV